MGDKFKYKNSENWTHEKCDAKFRNNNSKQSPINIDTGSIQECHTLCDLEINYKPNKCIINKKEDNIINIEYNNGSYIKYNNKYYELKWLQFHTPGLHTIDFNKSEMEIILYHSYLEDTDLENLKSNFQKKNEELKKEEKHAHKTKKKIDEYKVNKGIFLSILVNHDDPGHRKGETKATLPNQFIGQFIRSCNNKLKDNHKIEVHKDWNVSMLLPKKKTFYTYEGSLPYPPCEEEIKWIIFEDHIQVIDEFVNLFRLHGNEKGNRKLNPLNNRMVFYNNNIELKNGKTDIEKKEEEVINKNELIKNMLAPIRIQVNDIEGELYRKKANTIVASYYNENRDYMNDEVKARKLSEMWDDASRIGYEEIQITEFNETDDDYRFNNIYFNKSIEKYPDIDALIEEKLLLNTKPNTKKDYRLAVEKCVAEFKKDDNLVLSSQITTDKITVQTSSEDTDYDVKKLNLENHESTNISVSDILILEWYFMVSDSLYDYFISKKTNKHYIIKKIVDKLRILNQDLYLKVYSNELNTTLTGKKCQKWGTNKYHFEGSLFNIFRPQINIPEEGMTWEDISNHKNSVYIKKMIRDGLLKYQNGIWIPHDSCRNPNNSKYGSWCYTTDPKVRWDYCIQPSVKIQSKKYLLIILFFFIIFLAYYMVRLIFRFELFTQFMARITGAQPDTNVSGNQAPSIQPTQPK